MSFLRHTVLPVVLILGAKNMEIIIIASLILLNGLFSMSEIALISVRKARLSVEAENGNKLADSVLGFIQNPDLFLSTIQVGSTLISILTGLYSGGVLAAGFANFIGRLGLDYYWALPLAQVIIVVVVTYFAVVFGELVPKRIGLGAAERVSKIIIYPMRFVAYIAAPFVWVLSKSTAFICTLIGTGKSPVGITEEEIKSIVREGTIDGEVEEIEQHIVERVFSLGNRDLESIMTHRSEVVRIDVNMTSQEILSIVRKHPYNKYPVVDGSIDKMVGVVYVKDMLGEIHEGNFDIRRLVRQSHYFPETMGVYAALEEFKSKHLQYGVVCDEFGSIKGVVTQKDLLEALVGTIQEPHEEAEFVEREDGSFLVDGQCSFYDFLMHFNKEGLYKKELDYNTISGLILDVLGRIPQTGEKLEWNGFHMEIVDMDGARIDKVFVVPPGLDEQDT